MRVKMNEQEFFSLDDKELIWACIEPTIRQIRGRELMFKSAVYLKLNRGQQSVLMYQILHGHSAHGIDEFFGCLSYALTEEAFWKELSDGMRYLGDSAMANLIEEIHSIYPNYDLNDSEDIKARLDRALKSLMPNTTKLTADYIRDHVEEFAETDRLIFHE